VTTPARGLGDFELLLAWAWGSSEAGRLFYRRMFPLLNRYCANKLGSESDVEDLIQRTFLACMDARSRFSARSSVKAWLIGIAHNLLREHYRQKKRTAAELDFSQSSIRDLADGPSTLLGRVREEQILLEALRSIPLDMQFILELYYWERLSGPELVDFLGIPEPNIRSKLRRAKTELTSALSAMQRAPAPALTEEDLDAWARRVREAVFGRPGDGDA
jgi:RNA polymerase sigma-70 factor (ECF subfamily)